MGRCCIDSVAVGKRERAVQEHVGLCQADFRQGGSQILFQVCVGTRVGRGGTDSPLRCVLVDGLEVSCLLSGTWPRMVRVSLDVAITFTGTRVNFLCVAPCVVV